MGSPGTWSTKSRQAMIQPERLRQRQRHRQKDGPKGRRGRRTEGGRRGVCFPGVERRDAWGCLPVSRSSWPALSGRPGPSWPGRPRTRGPVGLRESDKVDGGRGTPGLPYLARPALARRETDRSRGRGVPAPARSLARRFRGSALSARPLDPRLSIAARPAPGPARPRPLLRSSPLPIFRSQPSLRLPPDSSAAPCPAPPALVLRGLQARSCPPRGAESSRAPTMRWSRCLTVPSPPGSDCAPESSRHGARGWEGH